MHFTISKQITRTSSLKLLLRKVFIGIPAVILAFIFSILLVIGEYIVKRFRPKKSAGDIDASPVESPLRHIAKLNSGNLEIELYNDKSSAPLAIAAGRWSMEVIARSRIIFKLKAMPSNPALDGRIVSSFIREIPGGFLFQEIKAAHGKDPATLDSNLMFYSFEEETVSLVENIGKYALLITGTSETVIKGINRTGRIELLINYKEGVS